SAAIDEAVSFTAYSEIDFERHEREIDALQREKRAIEEQSDVIALLKQRLLEAEDRASGLSTARDEAVAEESELKNEIRQAETLIANAGSELERRRSDGSLSKQEESFSELDAHFAEAPLTTSSLFHAKETFRVNQQDRITLLRQAIEPVKDQLL